MMDAIRSLPQGLFWYPLLLILTAVVVRTILVTTGTFRRRHRKTARATDALEALQLLVNKAHADWHSRMELERRCIGLFLQASGYSGYSIDNCRRYVSRMEGMEASGIIAAHLQETEPRAPHGGDRPATRTRGLERVTAILDLIERLTEGKSGRLDTR